VRADAARGNRWGVHDRLGAGDAVQCMAGVGQFGEEPRRQRLSWRECPAPADVVFVLGQISDDRPARSR
jgi:hypothetical protein